MNVGLCGAHRTGKTTLAMELATLHGAQFVRTRVSEIFRECGLHPAQPMDFATRLNIQFRLLEACESDWQAAAGNFITDRTPVDLMAYTLGDIQGETAVNEADFERYIECCFAAANRFFDTLIIIQPGIPLEAADGKAALNKAYIEHINSLIIGLCHDERLRCRVLSLPREQTVLPERIKTLSGWLSSYAKPMGQGQD
ncbi:MAG TPA: AAA family ATPase, partial [Blastocatellia bacterium]|nr:AAA family ATPase [Blastocatellia bacterium]